MCPSAALCARALLGACVCFFQVFFFLGGGDSLWSGEDIFLTSYPRTSWSVTGFF